MHHTSTPFLKIFQIPPPGEVIKIYFPPFKKGGEVGGPNYEVLNDSDWFQFQPKFTCNMRISTVIEFIFFITIFTKNSIFDTWCSFEYTNKYCCKILADNWWALKKYWNKWVHSSEMIYASSLVIFTISSIKGLF